MTQFLYLQSGNRFRNLKNVNAGKDLRINLVSFLYFRKKDPEARQVKLITLIILLLIELVLCQMT